MVVVVVVVVLVLLFEVVFFVGRCKESWWWNGCVGVGDDIGIHRSRLILLLRHRSSENLMCPAEPVQGFQRPVQTKKTLGNEQDALNVRMGWATRWAR